MAPSISAAVLPSLRATKRASDNAVLQAAAATSAVLDATTAARAAEVKALNARIEVLEATSAKTAALEAELASVKDEIQAVMHIANEAKAAAAAAAAEAKARPAAAAAAGVPAPAVAAAPRAASGKLLTLSDKESRVFSQNGEDGVIEAIFGAIGTTNKYYVEFGTETGVETNSRRLRENLGWTGLLLDGGNEDASINLHKHFLTAENIDGLFSKYGVPRELDLLSVDVDRNDWYIMRKLVAPKPGSPAGDYSSAAYRPRVVIVEYNSDWAPPQDKVVAYDGTARWDGTK